MIVDYINYAISFFAQAVNWMSQVYVVDGVSLLYFLIAVALLCIIIGGILIR